MFDQAVKLQPGLSFAYGDRAEARLQTEDYHGAEADLTKAIQLAPGYYWHYIDRGRLRLQYGNNKKGALEDFKTAVKLNPSYFLGYVYLAGLYDDEKDYTDAGQYYKKLLELRPDYYFVYRPYAVILYMEKKWNLAREYFEKAHKAEPSDYGSQMFVVLTYMKEKNNLEATSYLKQMIAELPRDGLFYSLAKMYLDPSYDVYFINRMKEEKNPDVRTRMLFYLACFYELRGKAELAQQYFLDVESHPIEGMWEYPVNKWELENYRK
jgi:tetratricopeptide (TPR) repeat protein